MGVDQMTVNNIQNWNLTRRDRDISEKFQIACEMKDLNHVETRFGTVVERCIENGRKFLIHTPNELSPGRKPLIVYLHGSRGNAMYCALERTRWIERSDCFVVFGQAEGTNLSENRFVEIDRRWKRATLSFGEKYWEIRDTFDQFKRDIAYLDELVAICLKEYPIDPNTVFLLGHSNGGVFSCLVPLYLPNRFTRICSHHGGIGWDPNFYLDFTKSDQQRRTPMLFLTGDQDVHRSPCEAANQIFTDEGFDSELVVRKNTSHGYNWTEENFIFHWFITGSIDPNLLDIEQ